MKFYNPYGGKPIHTNDYEEKTARNGRKMAVAIIDGKKYYKFI